MLWMTAKHIHLPCSNVYTTVEVDIKTVEIDIKSKEFTTLLLKA
jgi:hypothetical protein